MTFGQMLKQILSVCGIRLTHFANALGYDSSYVSRWISDTSLPSLKNNNDLFAKIAAALISCCDTKERERLIQEYCPQNPEELTDVLETLLANSYKSQGKPDQEVSPIEQNAVYMTGNNIEYGHGLFQRAFRMAADASQSRIVECLCGTPLSKNGNVTAGFFTTVLQNESGKSSFKIHVRQLIDMKDFESNTDTCCAAICTFVKYDPKVFYTFYEYDSGSDTKPYKVTCL